MDKTRRFLGLFFGICASAAVFLFALARHNAANIDADLYNIVAQQMLIHAFFGMILSVFHEKFGRFYCVPIIFCILGILLFCFPVILRASHFITHSPTAPFGGLSFNLAWLSAGISIFIGSKQNDKT